MWGWHRAQHLGHLVTDELILSSRSTADGCHTVDLSPLCSRTETHSCCQKVGSTDLTSVPQSTGGQEVRGKPTLLFTLCLRELIQILANLNYVVYQTPKRSINKKIAYNYQFQSIILFFCFLEPVKMAKHLRESSQSVPTTFMAHISPPDSSIHRTFTGSLSCACMGIQQQTN